VADSYFVLTAESRDGGRYLSGPATEGPWDRRHQHGGPPNALAVSVAERVLRATTGRDDFVAVRLAADFLGPVPVAELDVRAEVIRAARSAALVAVTVAADGRTCLLDHVWFVRRADTSAVASAAATMQVPDIPPMDLEFDFGYGASLEWRFLFGRMGEPGPAAGWVRPRVALVGDEPVRGLALATLVADSGNGISAELDWTEWLFPNVDIAVHLARPVHGEWLLLDAATQLGSDGWALARSTISDVRGLLGSALQTLVLSPR
jgi:acyl-coenzyme A thioesterase PaaI-like protein